MSLRESYKSIKEEESQLQLKLWNYLMNTLIFYVEVLTNNTKRDTIMKTFETSP